eukprot:878171-Pyramimonas_sp.AAC.1
MGHYFLAVVVRFSDDRSGADGDPLLDVDRVPDADPLVPGGAHVREGDREVPGEGRAGEEGRAPDAPGAAPAARGGVRGAEAGGAEETTRGALIYAAILEKKSDTPKALQRLLAQIRTEHGSMPSRLVYRIHSGRGLEFVNTTVDEYLRFHGISHTTTQGYDPSSNGVAENAVGLLKKRARYLLSGSRLPTRWWGMSILAAAHLYRVDAGYADPPKVPFGTRVMVNVDPQPRNAFLPRALPAT